MQASTIPQGFTPTMSKFTPKTNLKMSLQSKSISNIEKAVTNDLLKTNM